ncbi:hypothetical protein [Caviibacterium pharyngocola]|uniref:Uncharacterized protein n=1 Tax=Caviibacterium pharyngocola TaxID=28159 RepID=A0A2M8RXB7_9PAST|nr:hypothetical protein [Caviibacterium pharyngocola]PJG83530.1 hypothetical protein CVP04_03945 [Caviibacterium pharyngocola]
MKNTLDKKEALLDRLDKIAKSLENNEGTLALLALGSCGLHNERLDQYSDLDFFVIVQDGYKNRYIDNLFWLENINNISFSYKNTVDGHRVLFQDEIFCEFAIFEKRELAKIPYDHGRLVWSRDEFDKNLCVPIRLPNDNDYEESWLINEIMTCLYLGLSREKRGEVLSAFFLIQQRAINRIIDLWNSAGEENPVFTDKFNNTRRFEQIHPTKVKLIRKFTQGYDHNQASAGEILTYLDQTYPINQHFKDVIMQLLT